MTADLFERMRTHLGCALGFPQEVVEHTVELARKQVGKQLAELKAALAQGDATAARTAAHTLKGDLGNIGLQPESAVAQNLEVLLKEKRLNDAHPLCARLQSMVEALLSS